MKRGFLVANVIERVKNETKQKKSIIMQWILPTCVFFVAVIILVFTACVDLNNSVEGLLNSKFEDAAQYYASSFYGTIHSVREATIPVGIMLDQKKVENEKEVVSYLGSLAATSVICDAWMVSSDGTGIAADGRKIQITDDALFDAIHKVQKQTVLAHIDGQKRVAYVYPIQEGARYLISFYDPEFFLVDTSVFHMDTRTCYFLIDDKGEIITLNTGTSKFMDMNYNVIKEIQNPKNIIKDYSISQIQYKIEKKSTFSFDAVFSQNERFFVFSPARVENWYFVMSMPGSYLQLLRNKNTTGIRHMIIYVVVSLVIFFVVVTVINVLNKRKARDQHKELETKADTDLLTGLNNKMATERKIKEYISENPDTQAMMFVLDIDNFKKINDTMGHAFGDEVLRNIGMRLKAEFRMSDVIGRAGGDEFILLLKNISTEELIQKEADKVIQVFKGFEVGAYTKYTVTASIGCAIFPRDARDFESLYKAADNGLYKAKRAGKNQLAFYQDKQE